MAVKRLLLALLLVLWGAAAQPGSARMQLEVTPGLLAEADYWPGAADKAAVLILHGFLQTREFPTVRRLATALADEGYSVLTPTLTLGINRRSQSMACEAIHTHSIEHDVNELVRWLGWLGNRTGKAPIVVGHSTGGVQLVALLSSRADLKVESAVLISLSYFNESGDAGDAPGQRARAAAALRRHDGPGEVGPFQLSYCREYVTTPALLLSYLAWDGDRLRTALHRVGAPVTVIAGGDDERLDRRWLDDLRESGAAVQFVPGANHFFDVAYEFDLFDEVVAVIEGDARG